MNFALRNDGFVLTEDSFNMFYYVLEIYDFLTIRNVNAPNVRIIFPNLRIIRGRELLPSMDMGVAIRLDNVNVAAFILPRLGEISRGNVYITNNGGKCFGSTSLIRWRDILADNETYMDANSGNCLAEGESCLRPCY